jgi:hypothetical protein
MARHSYQSGQWESSWKQSPTGKLCKYVSQRPMVMPTRFTLFLYINKWITTKWNEEKCNCFTSPRKILWNIITCSRYATYRLWPRLRDDPQFSTHHFLPGNGILNWLNKKKCINYNLQVCCSLMPFLNMLKLIVNCRIVLLLKNIHRPVVWHYSV